MAALVVMSESPDWHVLCVSGQDTAALLRNYRSRNKRITGISLVLYVPNDVIGGRIVARALDTSERKGVRRDGRYVAGSVAAIEAAFREEAKLFNVPILTPAERLALGEQRLGRK